MTLKSRPLLGLALLAGACANILGIEEPQPRPVEPDSGAAGQGGADGGEGGASGSAGSAGIGMGGGGTSAGDAGQAGDGGEGGADSRCEVGSTRCGGAASKHPEVCDDGDWVPNTTENDGQECPVLCAEGTCTECVASERNCNGNVRQECLDGFWDDKETCPAYCLAGTCENPPSCSGLNPCAGPKNCCEAIEVPGGEFKRDYDGNIFTNDTFPATIDTFLLDKFEVTVGRMRNFVAAYSAIILEEGDGKSPHIADDEGWHESYPMPSTTNDLLTLLRCPDASWLDEAGAGTNENLPANCVPFHVAYAFCIWDGGRLPTEAEWNYAAAGGSEQREFPWVRPATIELPLPKHAYFGQLGGLPIDVGSKPDGNGRWGHSDLTGNLLEWTLDFYAEPYPETCDNCLNADAAGSRSLRGASYIIPAEALMLAMRWEAPDDSVDHQFGFRCARDLE